MTTQLYSAFFDHAAFPWFSISDQGKIVYKNPAASKYLPMLRKNASALKHFYPAEMPRESGPIRILGDTPYHIALVLKNETDFLALCFSRFQCEDGVQAALSLLSHYGKTVSDFICAFHREASQAYDRQTERVYTDLLEIIEGKETLSSAPTHSFFEIVSLLFEKLNHSFGALGYRIHTEIEKDFLSQKEIVLRLHDFLFLFGRLLYLQIRISENGNVSVTLTSDEKAHIFRICVKTDKIAPPIESARIREFVLHAVPECEAELVLLDKAGMIRPNRLKANVDLCGHFTIEYHVPYAQNTKNSLKSTDFSHLLLAADIEAFLLSIEKLLRDNGASY